MDPETQDPIAGSPDEGSQDISNQSGEKWMVRHNSSIIGFYPSKDDAVEGMNGYQMQQVIDLNDELEIFQVI